MDSQNISLTPKTIAGLILALVVILFLNFYQLNPGFNLNKLRPAVLNETQGIEMGETIADCRNCIQLKKTGIPQEKDIGEYIDYKLAQKLGELARINSKWRITEAYPATVKHISPCHVNGTCADIGLYRNQINKTNLSNLCRDALNAGLTIVNEYYNKDLFYSGSSCPDPNIFETTTGGHLHVQ